MKKINKNKILYSPTDLNNFVSCKYHIKNDLLADEKKYKKKELSADLKLRIKYGNEHETKHFKLFKNKNIGDEIIFCGGVSHNISVKNHLESITGHQFITDSFSN